MPSAALRRSPGGSTSWRPAVRARCKTWDECLPAMLRERLGAYPAQEQRSLALLPLLRRGLPHHLQLVAVRARAGLRHLPAAGAGAAQDGGGALTWRGRAAGATGSTRRYASMLRDEDYSTPQWIARALDYIDRNHAGHVWHGCTWRCSTRTSRSTVRRAVASRTPNSGTGTTSPGRYTGASIPSWTTSSSVRHVRACYCGELTMADHWLGQLLDKPAEYRMWEDTLVGADHRPRPPRWRERGYWGKLRMALYDEPARLIPFIV